MTVQDQVEKSSVLWERFLKTPIVRGRGDIEGTRELWHVCGTGRKLAWGRKMAVKGGDIPDNWAEKLGDEFVNEMCQTEWKYYECPQCKASI
jgi:hypothetical protein